MCVRKNMFEMEIELENWSRTLLYCYRYLGKIVETIDDMVAKISIESMFYRKNSTNNTMAQVEKILELNDRKVNLTNLKVIIEECVDKLPLKDMQLISLFYFDGLTFDEIASVLGISRRTVFRRRNNAITHFKEELFKKVTFDYLMTNYAGEQWLIDFYNYSVKKYSQIEIFDENKSVDNGKYIYRTLKALRKMAV